MLLSSYSLIHWLFLVIFIVYELCYRQMFATDSQACFKFERTGGSKMSHCHISVSDNLNKRGFLNIRRNKQCFGLILSFLFCFNLGCEKRQNSSSPTTSRTPILLDAGNIQDAIAPNPHHLEGGVSLTPLLTDSSTISSSPWVYQAFEHEMGGQIRIARAVSDKFEIGFPYGGPQRGIITIRQHPDQGLDVIIRISRGQIISDNYEDPQIRVRFGNGVAIDWSYSTAAGGLSNLIFLQNASEFIEKLKRATEVRIQMTLYNEGSRILRFDTAGLEWNTQTTNRHY